MSLVEWWNYCKWLNRTARILQENNVIKIKTCAKYVTDGLKLWQWPFTLLILKKEIEIKTQLVHKKPEPISAIFLEIKRKKEKQILPKVSVENKYFVFFWYF